MSDSILFWNEVALEANRISHTNEPREQPGPALSSRALAIVHLAMHDAYMAIDQNAGYMPYLKEKELPPAPVGASTQAAVAGAAHATLSALFPSQKNFFNMKLAEFYMKLAEAGKTVDPGASYGRKIAELMLEDRKDDPGVGELGYGPSLERGKHREDPDNPGQGFYAPFYGSRARGFAITERHTLNAPPFIDNDGNYKTEYQAALEQVRCQGIAPELIGTLPPGQESRSPEQTLIGIFWAYDGAIGLGTPPRLYNQIIRKVAMTRSPDNSTTPNTEAQNARLFALVNAAMADAGILAWEQKYCYDFWRPVVGIREHDPSIGPVAEVGSNSLLPGTDPGWLPLGAPSSNAVNPNVPGRVALRPMMPVVSPTDDVPERPLRNFTPNFPAYPSGHATFGAAALHITRLFYEVQCGNREPDELFKDLDFVSDELNNMNQDVRGTVRPRHRRSFPNGLWDMIIENGLSRVFLGVHWVFDAFALDKDGQPDFSQDRIGGVPLGLKIAEDIFNNKLKRTEVKPLAVCSNNQTGAGAKQGS